MLSDDLRTLSLRIRNRLGWPLLAVIAGGLVILIALALTPGRPTLAAPRPAPQAETKPEAKPDTPAMGEVSDAPKKPSPAIPKKPRRSAR